MTDNEKLINLGALNHFKEMLNAQYATKTEVESVQSAVENIELDEYAKLTDIPDCSKFVTFQEMITYLLNSQYQTASDIELRLQMHDVCFYNEDGSQLIDKIFCVSECDDVSGMIEPPTKEDAEGQVYTFDGWSATPGGPRWDYAETNIQGHRNLYARFINPNESPEEATIASLTTRVEALEAVIGDLELIDEETF